MSSPIQQISAPANGFGAAARNEVTVICGVWSHTLSLPKTATIGEVRACWADRFNIPASACAVVDGRLADEATVLKDGQVLLFVRPAGEMGPPP